MEENKNSVVQDIKDLKGWILGVVSFATAISAFCSLVLHWDAGKVAAIAAAIAIFSITLAFLIHLAENRNVQRLEAHIKSSNESIDAFRKDIDYLKDMTLENNRSSIRIEMNSIIRNEPQNHDTILAYAEKYFVELDGDWKETDYFFKWIANEQKAGREVFIPPQLKDAVYYKRDLENKRK